MFCRKQSRNQAEFKQTNQKSAWQGFSCHQSKIDW